MERVGRHASLANSGFPTDDYTPHGYLAQPGAYARSWSHGVGGNLRSTRDAVGFGWLYPWARDATAGVQIEIAVAYPDRRGSRRRPVRRRAVSRGDFQRDLRLRSSHHTSQLFRYDFGAEPGWSATASFALHGEDRLVLDVALTTSEGAAEQDDAEPSSLGGAVTLYIAAVAWWRDGSAEATSQDDVTGWQERIRTGDDLPIHHLLVERGVQCRALGTAATLAELIDADGARAAELHGEHVAVGFAAPLEPVVGQKTRVTCVLSREKQPSAVDDSVRGAIEAALRADDEFWKGAARLEGDWPDHWRRGWVYDIETTRMCLAPAGGVFADVWPSWMIQWPRAVLAEGTLDTFRLAYASPELAQRAILSLFRDAPAPNVPCIFQHGEPNMVARDGSVCGTSPAWCAPFYNLERLYLHTLDRGWLAELYPYLARYLDWWCAQRSDTDGWATYKCTWEAGEDDTPRLDPDRRGDNVVSEYVRPVELQATVSLSASVLSRFAGTLGRPDDAARWRALAALFGARTQALWDPAAGRFRDWDRRSGRFLEPAGAANYWGIDPCRYSALAFTPILAGLADAAQIRALARELEHYAGPPWTLWASWSYVVLESALAAGERGFASRVAAEIVDRVYNELDGRIADLVAGPTPGVAREYWPIDLTSWDACEGYGWGATTASFVVRQIFGFLEGDDEPGLPFRLAPGLPTSLLQPGRRYALLNVPYRGAFLDLEYTVSDDSGLTVQLRAGTDTTCRVTDERGLSRLESRRSQRSHHFSATIGELYLVQMTPSGGQSLQRAF